MSYMPSMLGVPRPTSDPTYLPPSPRLQINRNYEVLLVVSAAISSGIIRTEPTPPPIQCRGDFFLCRMSLKACSVAIHIIVRYFSAPSSIRDFARQIVGGSPFPPSQGHLKFQEVVLSLRYAFFSCLHSPRRPFVGEMSAHQLLGQPIYLFKHDVSSNKESPLTHRRFDRVTCI